MLNRGAGYRTYWLTWAMLLTLTLAMLATGYLSLSRGLILSLLLAAMLAKASLIGGYFMHLRFEKPVLVIAVAVGTLATAATLFVIIAFDGVRILALSGR